ncbi:MAG: ThiF family adenylyltransferase [Phycisphaerae bacterium]|nr:ThiF family adenylyltransferase [Phycisphaerae bacterium]
MTEVERVQNIMRDVNSSKDAVKKLKYDPSTRTLRPASCYDDPDCVKPVTHQDMNLYMNLCAAPEACITISGSFIEQACSRGATYHALFSSKDNGTVFTLLQASKVETTVNGSLIFVKNLDDADVSVVGCDTDSVRVLVQKDRISDLRVKGYINKNGKWQQARVNIVPVKQQLFSRFAGILETNVLSEKHVLIAGLGSGGSAIAVRLAQSGIMNFTGIDHDRFEVGNIARHAAGISDVGRLKINIVRDLIHEKNPYATVKGVAERISWDNIETFRELVKQVDLVICATDNRISKRIMNRLCIEENKVLIVAGAFRRAYGGQVLRVRPGKSLCFQCFLDSLPQQAQDQEITSIEQSEGLAYTDRPVPIEPGLSNDIAPINQMVVKLAIQELLKGTDTTLKSLDEDLTADLYLWLNRRESQTGYEDLEPLEYNVDGITVMRWYGIDISKNPACPECGNFLAELSKRANVTVTKENAEEFTCL